MSGAGPGSGIAAVRGAIDVPANTARDIQERTALLLQRLIEANGLDPSRIVSALFTTTADLDADFPAHAARRLGWTEVPMLHAREIPVPGSMPRVVRVLLTVRDQPARAALRPVYLDETARLRPDLAARAPAAVPAPQRARSRRLALIGLGQIGGSIGLSLAGSPGWRRVGWDIDRATLARALAAGAVDEGARSLAEACAHADLAILATPVDTLPMLIGRVADLLPRSAALMDTGSARAGLGAALRRAAGKPLRVVGGHPLAGSEGHGFAAARADLLRGAPFVLLPVRSGVPPIVRALLGDLGARAVIVTPGHHDRALARTSHLPYLLAGALRRRGARFALAGLAGPGYRDMTRLAGSDRRIAEAYCRANRREVRRAWRELRAAVDRAIRGLGPA